MTSLELREQKTALCAEERKIFEAAQEENRAYTVDELEKIERIEQDIREIDSKYEALRQEEAAAAVEARMSAPVGGSFTMSGTMGTDSGPEGPGVEQTESRWIRNMLEGRTTQTTSNLGAVIPKPLQNRMIQLLDRVSAVRQAAEVYSVASPQRVPRQTGYGTSLQKVAEAGAFTAFDPQLDEIDTGQKLAKGAGICTLSNELLFDSLFDIESFVMNMLGEQAGHLQEGQFISGNGSGEPEGLMVAITGANTFDTGGTDLDCTKVTTALLTKMPPQYMGLPRYLIVGQEQAAALLSDTDGSGTGRLLLQQQASATFANMPSMSILGTQILISSQAPGGSGGGGAFANGDYLGTILTSGSYGIYDHGGFQMTRDPYSAAENGLVKVSGYIRSAGCVSRPQSIVQITF